MILGIDPGVSGAIAAYLPRGDILLVHDMPTFALGVNGARKRRLDLYRLAELIATVQTLYGIERAYIEEVHSMPRQGVASSFAFGFAAGAAQGVVAALGIPVERVEPQRWKRHFRLTRDKDMSRRRASELLPQYAHLWPKAGHDGRAEATLIAIYGAKHG